MSAVPSAWFGYVVAIERKTGDSATGPVYAASVATAAMIDAKQQQIKAPSGQTVLSSGSVFLPPGTAYVPPGSRITLPDTFGGRVAEAAGCQVFSSPMPTPDHVAVTLL